MLPDMSSFFELPRRLPRLAIAADLEALRRIRELAYVEPDDLADATERLRQIWLITQKRLEEE